MKDVSKQTLEDLMTFIYRGEVNVNQDNLEEFFNTAKSLEIKGLTDGNYAQSFNVQAPKSSSSEPAQNGFQYQSSQTVQISLNPAPSNYYQQQDNFEAEENNGSAEKGHEMGNNHYDNDISYGMDGDDFPMDQEFDVQSEQWDSHYNGGGTDENPLEVIAPKAKRVKQIYGL